MNVTESIPFATGDAGPYTLKGGRYMIGCTATFGGGDVAFQALLPDGSTYATVPDIAANAVDFSAAGWKTADLAPGQYKIVITTSTAVKLRASLIPD